MLELKTQTYKAKIEIDPEIVREFKYPIIFYLAHKDDQRFFFITFVILDLQKSEISYIRTYSPENIEKVENYEQSEIFRAMPVFNPHCSIRINDQDEFLTFVERTGFFFKVMPKENRVIVLTGKDLKINQPAHVREFGATFYKTKESEQDILYLTAISDQQDGTDLLNFYRSSLDLNDIQPVFSTPSGRFFPPPHATRKYGDYLLNSEFSAREFKNKKTGEIFKATFELYRYVYRELYKEFCETKGEIFSEECFLEKNKIDVRELSIDPEFREFCETKGRDFIDICTHDPRFDFSVLPGTISLVDPKNHTIDYYHTSCCAPAHFEVDEREDFVYTSSHNFSRFHRLFLFGPVAIDKFRLREGKLEKVGTFSDPTAYRCTTHKVFRYKDKPYICTFGQPNRLFFIDAETMTTLFYDDIGEDVLSGKILPQFLNNTVTQSVYFRGVEVSSSGEVIFFMDHQYIYFYSFPERRVLTRLPYFSEYATNPFFSGFYNRTIHCDYLR